MGGAVSWTGIAVSKGIGGAPSWRDPRLYQILILSSLLVYGVTRLDLEIPASRALLLLAAALLTQYACTRLWRLPAFDPRSALISGLSLCLLLRTNSRGAGGARRRVDDRQQVRPPRPRQARLQPHQLRHRGDDARHRRQVWVSPGQWGSAAFFAFLLACLGGLVVNRAARSDVTYAFLAFYLAILFGRALWLGQPLAIPLHQLESGAFLIFTFFMISDPQTTPDSRAGRILFALLVALGAGYVQFVLYRPNGLLLSLVFLSPAVPLIDRLLPGAPLRLARAGPPVPSPSLLEERRFA